MVVYTTVDEAIFRGIACALVNSDYAPAWFVQVEFIKREQKGGYKDPRKIPHAELDHTVIIDDYAGYIHPDQKDHWLKIETYFDQDEDNELSRIKAILTGVKKNVARRTHAM